VHDHSSLFWMPTEGIVRATNPAPTLDPSFAVEREDRGEVSRFCRASLRAGVARLLARSVQDAANGLLRIPLPRTPVNKLPVNAPHPFRWHHGCCCPTAE
jgi:hypothetical protein